MARDRKCRQPATLQLQHQRRRRRASEGRGRSGSRWFRWRSRGVGDEEVETGRVSGFQWRCPRDRTRLLFCIQTEANWFVSDRTDEALNNKRSVPGSCGLSADEGESESCHHDNGSAGSDQLESEEGGEDSRAAEVRERPVC